jgi:catechol 1,2-dioxygenase
MSDMVDRNGRCSVWFAIALSATLAACSGSGNRSSTEPTASPSVTAADECRPTIGGEADGSAPVSSEASSFVKLKPGSAITSEEAAAEAPARRGTPLILSGTVYAADCRTPLPGALIEVWQTDARGVYGPDQESGEPRCCFLQGLVKTDANGRYSIQTIRPGHYRGEGPPPPAHIHFNVHYGETPGLLTEVFFAGDPYLAEGESHAEVIRLRKDSGPDGERLVGRFDIVLAGEP